jgi:hypothetical protein
MKWKAVPTNVGRRVFTPGDTIEIQNERGQFIACTYSVNHSHDGSQDRENARLLAAAPELLRYARITLTYIETLQQAGIIQGNEPWVGRLAELVREVEEEVTNG